MLSRLFTISILALSGLASATVLPVDETAATIVERDCQPACCDLLVRADDDSIAGLRCTSGGLDCAFSGQVTACCNSINELTDLHVGYQCSRAS